MPSEPKITVHGHISLSNSDIAIMYARLGGAALNDCFGQYVIVVEGDNFVELISSFYGTYDYYYACTANDFVHGNTLSTILATGLLEWRYNFQAIGNLFWLHQMLENETIHPNILRVPPRSIVRWSAGRLTITSTDGRDEMVKPTPTSLPGSVRELNRACFRWAADDVVLSMSGGLDSRVLLSSLLYQGISPRLLVMGSAESTDVVISQQIAKSYGLELERVEIHADDYITMGLRAAELSSGAIPAQHWHSHIYVEKSQTSSEIPFFEGINGEIARSSYSINVIRRIGRAGLWAADRVPQLTIPLYWKRRIGRKVTLQAHELAEISEDLRAELDRGSLPRRAERLTRLTHPGLLRGLDKYFLEQRARNFQCVDNKLIGQRFRLRAPMLDRPWVEAIEGLPQGHKFDASWHRYAIRSNEPHLLDFEFEYEIKRDRPGQFVPYVMLGDWFASPVVLEFLDGNRSFISDLVSSKFIDGLIRDQRCGANRTDLVGVFISLINWSILIAGVAEARQDH